MADAPAPRRRRWPRRLAIACGLLALLVFFAPWIAARLGLAQVVVAKALVDVDGTVSIGSASLGWFAPVELRDVRLADAQERTILAAPRNDTSKTLLGF